MSGLPPPQIGGNALQALDVDGDSGFHALQDDFPHDQSLADVDMDDGDSALGDDTASETRSITDSVLGYEYENGRRYHAYRAGKYPMPNDEAEQERMDMQHHIYLLIYG
ncbi:hypothetical protein KC352_g35270, partial [Hortaea werneckii]